MAVINTQRGTAAALTATNPVIADGQVVYETDTGLCKIGDGVTAWTSLRYVTVADGAITLAKTTGVQKSITSGTAAPTGGSSGDIYLRYS